MRTLVVVLILVALGLGGGWIYRHKKATKEKETDIAAIQSLSNEWKRTEAKLDEQVNVNRVLDSALTTRNQELVETAKLLNNTKATLVKTEAEAKAAAEAAAAEVAKRDAQIAKLEGERDDLTKRMTVLNTEITGLEGKITDTEHKLAASEGDREFLLKELKRLQAEKADLERQFNDLAMLRDQVRKLRDELAIARRLDWIRRGLYGTPMKGAERLQKGFAQQGTETNYSLNVELRQDGQVKVLPPVTNAPASTNSAPK